jgi:mevalonate kinase
VPSLPPLPVLVTNTHVPKETSRLVAGVRVLHDALPGVIEPVLTAINGISREVLSAFAECAEDDALAASAGATPRPGPPRLTPALYSRLCRAIKINQCLLNAVGVGHEALDRVVALSARAGLAAKLTGAGGGGCALTLLPPPGDDGGGEPAAAAVAELKRELQAQGWDCFETMLGGRGVEVAPA